MNNEFLSKISQLQTDFYSKNGKNVIFKKQQKLDCASAVSQQLSIDDLLNQTVYIIPNTNKVYFNYTIFKLYANPNNYEQVVIKIMKSFQLCIQTYGSYEAHINLDSFTISSCERYKQVIELYYRYCMASETTFALKIDQMFIYYCPSAIDTITRMLHSFIEPNVRNRMTLYDKKMSGDLITALHK